MYLCGTPRAAPRERETEIMSEKVQRGERKRDIEPMTNQGVPVGSADALFEKE